MIRKLAAAFPLAVAVVAAVGCASGPGLETRVAELTRENEDLQRKNTELEGQLAASESKCQTLERDSAGRKGAPMKTGERTNEYRLPDDLEKSGVRLRTRGNETIIELPTDLFFASGAATLNGGGEKALASVCAVLQKQHPSGILRIEGHTDSDPIRRTKSKFHCNFDLGFERAHQVAHYLIEKGKIDPHRVTCESFGENQPRDSKNKSKNRRVEIVLAR